jgi:hypothetical protein
MFFNKFVFLIISAFYFIFINPSLNKKITHITNFFTLRNNYKNNENLKYNAAINQEISRDDNNVNLHFYINTIAYNINFVIDEYYNDSLFQVSDDEDENKLKIVENEMLYKRRINMFLSK